jgi:hypothetical protein
MSQSILSDFETIRLSGGLLRSVGLKLQDRSAELGVSLPHFLKQEICHVTESIKKTGEDPVTRSVLEMFLQFYLLFEREGLDCMPEREERFKKMNELSKGLNQNIIDYMKS